MTKPSFIARCTLSEQSLPDTPYRAMLCKLHKDMLDEIDLLKAAQRQWVGLTDEEFDYLRDNNFGVSPLISAVEAKLKEKNT
jgi:hypothetical protein